jgi:hypothetical protein
MIVVPGKDKNPNFEAVVLLIPIPCPRSKTVLASSQVGALTLLKTTLMPPIALVAWQWLAAAPPVAPLASPRVSAAAAQVLTRRARRG